MLYFGKAFLDGFKSGEYAAEYQPLLQTGRLRSGDMTGYP